MTFYPGDDPRYRTTSAGWVCPNCNAWIPSGMTHVCPDVVKPGIFEISPDWNKIIQLLERIAADLARIKDNLEIIKLRG